MKSKRTKTGSIDSRVADERPYADIAKVDATTEADIERHATEDGDIEWTPEMIRRSHTFRPRKRHITMRLDPDVVDFFAAQGRGYQSRINAVLRAYVEQHRKAG